MTFQKSSSSRRSKRTKKSQQSSPSKKHKMSTSRFFDLPRELRDNIYTLLLTENQEPGSKDDTPSLHFMPLLRFQLVSQQFGKEYTEAIRKYSTMIIYKGFNPRHNYKQYTKQVGHIQTYFKLQCEATPTGGCMNCHPEPGQIKADNGTIHEHSFTCRGVTEAQEWVERLHKMQPNLPLHERLDLRIGLYWCSDEDFAWPRHIHAPGLQYHLDAMTKALSTVNSVEIALFDCNPDYEIWTKNKSHMGLWAKWTKNSGWQAGEAKGRRKFGAGNLERPLNAVREEEGWKIIRSTMKAMDSHW